MYYNREPWCASYSKHISEWTCGKFKSKIGFYEVIKGHWWCLDENTT
jgi:hypothetical protein